MANPIDLCTVADVRQLLDLAPSGIKIVTVTGGGAGYTTAAVTVVPVDGNGTNAVLTPILLAGAVVGITITNAGQGFTKAPTLTITGNGSGATATAGLNDDDLLGKLVTRASTLFNTECNRPTGLLQQTVTEKRNGNGNDILVPYNWPITAVSALYLNNNLTAASSDGIAAGYLFADRALYLVGGLVFTSGRLNVSLSYTFGYSVIPYDVTQAVAELVASRYRRRGHYDQDSQALNQQVISFSRKDIPPEVQTVINNYSLKAIVE